MRVMKFAEVLSNKRGDPGTVPRSNGTMIGSKKTAISAKLSLENSKLVPDADQYRYAQAMLTELSGLAFTDQQTRMLLDLYPASRISVVSTRGIPEPYRSNELRKGLQFAVAHFFLMCAWPESETGEKLSAFKALLIKQGLAIGFKRDE